MGIRRQRRRVAGRSGRGVHLQDTGSDVASANVVVGGTRHRVPTQRHVPAGHRRSRAAGVPGLVPVGVAGTAAKALRDFKHTISSPMTASHWPCERRGVNTRIWLTIWGIA